MKRLKDIATGSKVLVLVTDGANNSGALSPLEAAKLANDMNVKVHVIGIGGRGPAPFVEEGFFGTKQLVNRPMEYDEGTLKKIAAATGGKYFNATNTEGLAEVYAEIIQRPLYRVHSGQLGLNVGAMETALKEVLTRAQRWGAVIRAAKIEPE